MARWVFPAGRSLALRTATHAALAAQPSKLRPRPPLLLPPWEEVAGKLICRDCKTLCGPGFGEGGKGPTWGYIY